MKVLIVSLYFPPPADQRPAPAEVRSDLPPRLRGPCARSARPQVGARDRTLRAPKGVSSTVRATSARAPGSRSRSCTTPGLDRLRRTATITLRRLPPPYASVRWNLTAITVALAVARREQYRLSSHDLAAGSVHFVGWRCRPLLRPAGGGPPRPRSSGTRTAGGSSAGRRPARKVVARRADDVVAASSGIAAEMRRLVPGLDVRVVENAATSMSSRVSPTGAADVQSHPYGQLLRAPEPPAVPRSAQERGRGRPVRFVGGLPSATANGSRKTISVEQWKSCRLFRANSARAPADSESLLLLIPEAEGRGRSVLTAKIFEYLAAERPILAVVPPDGEAARLIRDTTRGSSSLL